MASKATSMMYPVHPGPVRKFALRKPTKPRLFLAASCAKLFQWANVWSREKNTIDQAVTASATQGSAPVRSRISQDLRDERLWKVIFLSKGMMPFRGVRLAKEIRFRQMATIRCRQSKLRGRARVGSVWRRTKKDQRHVHMQYECGCPSDGIGDAESSSRADEIVLEETRQERMGTGG